jgi:hypothetical protein
LDYWDRKLHIRQEWLALIGYGGKAASKVRIANHVHQHVLPLDLLHVRGNFMKFRICFFPSGGSALAAFASLVDLGQASRSRES